MAQRKVGIIVFDNAEVLDVMGPYEVFSVAGRISEPSEFQVVLISDSEEKSVTLRHGLRILTDRNIYEDAEFDLIIVSGGITTNAEQNKKLLEFLVKSKALGTIIASICTGAFILAEAGLLGKNKVTTHWEDQKELQNRFPDLTVIPNQRWVESEGIFTSGGISAGMDLSLHLVQVLSDRALALRTAKQMEYNWNQ
jgi:transcriptional regulator GlxA family with amidase domain